MVTFRRMTMEDVDCVSQLERETFSIPWSKDSFAQIVDNPMALFMIALDDGKHIGTCGMLVIAGEGDISNVAVAKEYRGKGIAYQLVGEAMKVAMSEYGATEFTLEVRAGNAPAIGLYQKLGFVSEGVRPGFYEKPVEDAVIMWKR